MKKSFTLIEILSAVLLIALIAAYVVPKIGAIKDNVKTAGVDTNMRTVSAYVNGVIDHYDPNQVKLFEDELAENFSDKDLMKNPFTKESSVKNIENLGSTKGASIVYSNSDNTYSTVSQIVQYFSGVSYNALRGSVGVAAYSTGTGIEVVVVPFNKNGKIIKSKVVTIKP